MKTEKFLGINALAIVTGIVISLITFLIAAAGVLSGKGLDYLNLVGELYPRWSPTILGACIMAFWMFLTGFFEAL
ncbi:MAG TPA: hypothetical protein PLU94_01815 [Methanoregulaceae archaeon]|nr:hypothetical protein [Methanoregulaceae archaeon]